MSGPNESSGESASRADETPAPSRSRRRGLTPEERRILGTARSLEKTTESTRADLEVPTPAEPELDERSPEPEPPSAAPLEKGWPVAKNAARRNRPAAQGKASHAIELRPAIFVLAILLFVVGIFWAGRKFDRVKYLIASRTSAHEIEGGPDKFPGASSEELIDTALAAEKRGDWQEAADRFLAAKRKDRALPGILFRIGKSSYDRGDLNGATVALDHALRFGENLPVANYYRGLIAVRQHELPAAAGYFEAATKAEPFVADFFYYWGEALRLDQHPREAIKRYQQAVQRTPSTSDATLCRFKIRLARIEAAEASQIAAEVEEARAAGSLSVDWLMTEAALQLHAGNIKDAAQSISEARAAGISGLFLTCAGDTIFLKASESHPEIAAVALATPPAR